MLWNTEKGNSCGKRQMELQLAENAINLWDENGDRGWPMKLKLVENGMNSEKSLKHKTVYDSVPIFDKSDVQKV